MCQMNLSTSMRRTPSSHAANKVTIAAAGAIQVFLKAMTAHAGHTGVNEQGCWALAILALNAANQVTIALPVIIKAI